MGFNKGKENRRHKVGEGRGLGSVGGESEYDQNALYSIIKENKNCKRDMQRNQLAW